MGAHRYRLKRNIEKDGKGIMEDGIGKLEEAWLKKEDKIVTKAEGGWNMEEKRKRRKDEKKTEEEFRK